MPFVYEGIDLCLAWQEREKQVVTNNKIVIDKNDRREIIKILRSMSNTLNTQRDKTQKAMEAIIKSCQKQGTKGYAHQKQYLRQAEEMKRLIALFRSVEERCDSVVMNLADGTQEKKMLTDLLGYMVFCNDQFKSEQKGYKRTISELRD